MTNELLPPLATVSFPLLPYLSEIPPASCLLSSPLCSRTNSISPHLYGGRKLPFPLGRIHFVFQDIRERYTACTAHTSPPHIRLSARILPAAINHKSPYLPTQVPSGYQKHPSSGCRRAAAVGCQSLLRLAERAFFL